MTVYFPFLHALSSTTWFTQVAFCDPVGVGLPREQVIMEAFSSSPFRPAPHPPPALLISAFLGLHLHVSVIQLLHFPSFGPRIMGRQFLWKHRKSGSVSRVSLSVLCGLFPEKFWWATSCVDFCWCFLKQVHTFEQVHTYPHKQTHTHTRVCYNA